MYVISVNHGAEGIIPVHMQAARHTSSALPDYSSMPSGSGLAPGMPMRMSWLPPATMDTSQDSVRRPPAA